MKFGAWEKLRSRASCLIEKSRHDAGLGEVACRQPKSRLTELHCIAHKRALLQLQNNETKKSCADKDARLYITGQSRQARV